MHPELTEVNTVCTMDAISWVTVLHTMEHCRSYLPETGLLSRTVSGITSREYDIGYVLATTQALTDSPSGTERRALLPIFLIVTVDVMGYAVMIPLLPFYVERTGASAFVVGLLISVFAFCQLLAGPVLGQLSDRYGRKPILLISQAGTLLGFIVLALANTLPLMFLARIMDGLTAGNISVAQAYISDNTPPERRTQAFGIIGAAFGVGMLIGPAISGFLARQSIHAPIWAAAALSLCSLVTTVFLLPRGTPTASPASKREILPWTAAREAFAAPATSRLFWLLTLFYLAFSTFISGLALFLAGRFRWHGQPFGPQQIGFYFTYAGLVGILVQTVLLKRIITALPEHRVILLAFTFMTAGTAGLALSGHLAVAVLWLTINGVGMGVLRPVIMSQISQRVPRTRQGAVMGVNQAVMSVTGIAAPLLAGLLIKHGLYTPWALLIAGFAACALPLALSLRPTPMPVSPATSPVL